jgi:hypothetical protein
MQPKHTETAGDRDIISYKALLKEGYFFFDIKQDPKGNEYLKITQSKGEGEHEYKREKIFLDKEDILLFKEKLEQVINYWNIKSQTPTTDKHYTLEDMREQHGNAYLPWEKSADEYLKKLYAEGKSINKLAEIFERNRRAITSRIRKLGLNED